MARQNQDTNLESLRDSNTQLTIEADELSHTPRSEGDLLQILEATQHAALPTLFEDMVAAAADPRPNRRPSFKISISKHDPRPVIGILLALADEPIRAGLRGAIKDYCAKHKTISDDARRARLSEIDQKKVQNAIAIGMINAARVRAGQQPDWRSDDLPEVVLAKLPAEGPAPSPNDLDELYEESRLIAIVSKARQLDAAADQAGEYSADVRDSVSQARAALASHRDQLTAWRWDMRDPQQVAERARTQANVASAENKLAELMAMYEQACIEADEAHARASEPSALAKRCIEWAKAKGHPIPPLPGAGTKLRGGTR